MEAALSSRGCSGAGTWARCPGAGVWSGMGEGRASGALLLCLGFPSLCPVGCAGLGSAPQGSPFPLILLPDARLLPASSSLPLFFLGRALGRGGGWQGGSLYFSRLRFLEMCICWGPDNPTGPAPPDTAGRRAGAGRRAKNSPRMHPAAFSSLWPPHVGVGPRELRPGQRGVLLGPALPTRPDRAPVAVPAPAHPLLQPQRPWRSWLW